MKPFILRCIKFLLITAIVLSIEPTYLVITETYKHTVAGSEIYHSLFKSKQKKKSKKILLGDSVGNQLFGNTTNNDTIYSLACNQAISMTGHFILLNNYLSAGNEVDTIFLIFSPFSFKNNLDQVYTYHYFLKPFYTDEYKPLFTKKVNEQIQKIPYFNFCRFSHVLASNWAPNFISKDSINYSFLSPISIEYLLKIKELSKKHNFKIIILPTPTPLNKKNTVEKLDKNEIVKNNLEHEFENYFKCIIYLNDSFFIDGTHIKYEYLSYIIAYYRNKLMQ